MKPKRYNRNRPHAPSVQGFTLVELMVALIVFGIGVVALAQVLPRGLEVRDKGRRITVATNLAQQQMERLRSLPFADADLSAGPHEDPANPINGHYRSRWTVQDQVPAPGMKTVVVTVAFPSADGDSVATVRTQRIN